MTLENISKSYGEKKLLNKISLGISRGERIGLVGINGTGKSTLLKIIVGIEKPDEGLVTQNNEVKIEFLSQNPDFDPEATVLEQVFKGNSYGIPILREYEKILQIVSEGDLSYNNELIKLQEEIERLNLWDLESEAKSILNKLGIDNYNDKVGILSGGQRKRIALAASLISPCEFLILDEPTNHMDSESNTWLEEYLKNRKGSLLMVTHDRYFLDRVTNKIIEVDEGNLYSYEGNYSIYLEKKAEREELEKNLYRKRVNLYKNELAWIRRGALARSTKQKARIDRFEQLKENINYIEKDEIDLSIVGSRLGKKIIEINSISKAYDDLVLINDFSYNILRDDRIGIVGPNGIGKSTLMKIISNRIKPDKGNISIGDTVKIGYFTQENERDDTDLNMTPDMRVIDYIKEVAEYLPLANGERITASKMLERFLFTSDNQYNQVGKLSGGERRRLYLLRILMSAPNVLLLDEPTNDFDTTTLAILEDFIDEFNGPVITVSHDRYFLDRICTQIIELKGNGEIKRYPGNYSDYLEKKVFDREEEKIVKIEKESVKTRNTSPKKLKFSYHEQKEFDEIDEIIEDLEEKVTEIEKEIEENATSYTIVSELMEEKDKVNKELEDKYERWTYLNELAEKIEQEKNK